MTTDEKITEETLQYDINRKAAKMLVLLSGKNNKYYILQVNYFPLIKDK